MTLNSIARDGLIFISEAIAVGEDPEKIRSLARRGQAVRLRRGVYCLRDRWEAADAREQHILRIVSVMRFQQRDVLVGGYSAAALWNVPVLRSWPTEVTLVDRYTGGGKTEPGVARTAAAAPAAFRTATELSGLPVTSLARTALDIARIDGLSGGVASIDSLLGRDGRSRIGIDDLWEELHRSGFRAGKHELVRALELATTLSGSFGESRARVGIHLLGFPPPILQFEFRDAEGRIFPDFLWKQFGVAAEFDGKMKYTRDRYTGGDPGEVVWREKLRQDRLGKFVSNVTRILTAHVESPPKLERLLLDAGVRR